MFPDVTFSHRHRIVSSSAIRIFISSDLKTDQISFWKLYFLLSNFLVLFNDLGIYLFSLKSSKIVFPVISPSHRAAWAPLIFAPSPITKTSSKDVLPLWSQIIFESPGALYSWSHPKILGNSLFDKKPYPTHKVSAENFKLFLKSSSPPSKIGEIITFRELSSNTSVT